MLESIVLVLALSAANNDTDLVVPADGVSFWVPVVKPMPEYPRRDLARPVNGCVALRFVVEPNGEPSDITVLASYPEGVFELDAKRALQEWRFEPGVNNPDRAPALLTQAFDFEVSDAINAPVSCVPAGS